MRYKVETIPNFDRELKKLAKKYHSIKNDYTKLLESLKENPEQGSSLGNECYKIRIAIASKGKGKSGGARVITCVKIIKNTVYLLSVFDKSDKESISDNEINELLQYLPL